MKKIIDGKLYNTETATLLAEWEDERTPNPNDMGYYKSSIYKTKKGAFFSVSGGPIRPYELRLLDGPGVLEWCEMTGLTKVLIEHFPNLVIEG